MEKFLNQLNALKEALPPMKKAVENIKMDCRTPDQPHGNIQQPVLDLICADCHSYENSETTHLEELVRSHRAIEKPDLYRSFRFIVNDDYLRRVCSLQNFVRYHLSGESYSAREMADVKKRDLQERLKDGELEIDMEELKGTTGKIGNPTWWTFKENGSSDEPSSGEAYMKELALGDMEIQLAAAENTVIELSIDQMRMVKNVTRK
ncbi:MAG: hypothetical protein MUF15_01770 [Acidobacteria bacterium]|jgi:hypothetical protein|nr:hypothetical protein [Acidobacteriota bacterium]